MKALVTGGAGFIGSHVVDALLRQGDEVAVIDDFSSGREQNLREAAREFGRALRIVKADICSKETFQEVLTTQPEAIYHFAAQMNVRRSVAEPQFDAEKNVIGTVNLLEAARQAGTKKFIFSSTGGAIYGEQEKFPADEQHRIRPECPYGVSKRSGELYIEYFAHTYGLRGAALRFANVYGPRQNAKGEAGVVAIFAERLFGAQTLRVNGDGKQTRDFVFVGDVVQAVLAASKRTDDAPFVVFNVGTGVETSVNELVESMRTAWSAIQKPGDPKFQSVEHAPALPGEQRRSVITPALIGRALGWQPRMKLAEGLEVTIEGFRPEK